MKEKILSIIIPVYNAEQYIERCVDCILRQVNSEYEILLISDGSRDRSNKIIQEYEKEYPDIVRAIIKENEGVAKTRNLGIKEAEGEYICFVDNDDFVDDDYFETFLSEINKNIDIVIGGYRRVEDDRIHFQVKPQNSPWYKFIVVAPWAKIYRKSFLLENKIEFLDYGLGEDVFFSVVAYSFAREIKIIDYSGYNWYFNERSVSNTSQKGFNEKLDPIYLLEKIYDRIGNKEKIYSYFYVRYGIWYLLFSGKQAGKELFIREYKKIFAWYKKCGIKERFPLFSKDVEGEKFTIKLIINVFLIIHKLKLVNLFAKLYCNGEDDE